MSIISIYYNNICEVIVYYYKIFEAVNFFFFIATIYIYIYIYITASKFIKIFRVCLVTIFFLSFLFSKTIFCFLRQKTCLVTYFRQKSKTILNFHIVKKLKIGLELFLFLSF